MKELQSNFRWMFAASLPGVVGVSCSTKGYFVIHRKDINYSVLQHLRNMKIFRQCFQVQFPLDEREH